MPMKPLYEQIRQKPWKGWALFLVSVLIVFLLGMLASSIIERRTEAVFAYVPQVKYSQFEPRNAIWGENFPREYQSYLQTADTSFRSKYNGSANIDMLAGDPRLVVLWAGYPFSKDYKQSRGHYYAVNDIWHTLRTGAPMGDQKSPMPNTCWTCKSPDVPRLMNEIGVAKFYEGSWETKGQEIINPIGCADCHDSKTMDLRISRPALIEAYQHMGKEINKVSYQEMRSLICAQCHVEYYFNKEKKDTKGIAYLTFPWDKGISVEDIEAYYDNIAFSDWTHALSRTPMLKAQHPDYEIYLTGTHASRGVSCTDCHMPYMSEGGQKYTSHHVTSPLQNISTSCQVCHRQETERLVRDVYERQDKIIQMRDTLEILLVRAHTEAKKAWDLGANENQMKSIMMDIRHAQWRWDYCAASHGASFHSPIEVSRIISSGIDIAQNARIKLVHLLANLGFNKEVPYPNLVSKQEAQKYIGLDMKKLNENKKEFLDTIIPKWIEQAKKREAAYPLETMN
jgi:nitrite reductase (cytochrome c-552)